MYELQRWVTEGVQGLTNKPHARRLGGRKMIMKPIMIVRRLQQNPHLGERRIHAALRPEGIVLGPRTVGRVLILNRKHYPAQTAPDPTKSNP